MDYLQHLEASLPKSSGHHGRIEHRSWVQLPYKYAPEGPSMYEWGGQRGHSTLVILQVLIQKIDYCFSESVCPLKDFIMEEVTDSVSINVIAPSSGEAPGRWVRVQAESLVLEELDIRLFLPDPCSYPEFLFHCCLEEWVESCQSCCLLHLCWRHLVLIPFVIHYRRPFFVLSVTSLHDGQVYRLSIRH